MLMCVYTLSTLLFNLLTINAETRYCSLHFVVDYPLWTLTFTTRANRDPFRTNTLLSSYIYRNLEGLNELYNQYRFPYTSRTKNITVQFFVHGISMATQHICDHNDPASHDPKNPLREFCSANINSDALLDLIGRFSDYQKKTSDNEPACLFYGLTSRKLKLENNQGTALGWSWRGHLCSELQQMPNWSAKKPGFNPRYSGNVGVVTASFDASDYSLNKGEMTFFHEIGHSMNANHDDRDEFKDRKAECNPSDDHGGSYLMFSTGTEGFLPNNRVYSHCSLDTISQYIERLSRMKPKCLSTTKSAKHRCDGIFSTDEICDEHGMPNTCCTADCKLKPGALCSPSAGSCCQSSCQFHRADHPCQPESDCKIAVGCTGTSATCPENDPRYFKPDRTICGAGTLLCINGSCSLSICALHSLLPCQLKEPVDQLCMIACQQKDGLCVPYQKIQRNSSSAKPLYFPYGSFCNSNHGFCDQSHQCLPLLLDENSNLIGAGLSSLLLTDYSSIFQRYWWAFLLFLLGQVILIPLVLLHVRSSCIPSDNPFVQ